MDGDYTHPDMGDWAQTEHIKPIRASFSAIKISDNIENNPTVSDQADIHKDITFPSSERHKQRECTQLRSNVQLDFDNNMLETCMLKESYDPAIAGNILLLSANESSPNRVFDGLISAPGTSDMELEQGFMDVRLTSKVKRPSDNSSTEEKRIPIPGTFRLSSVTSKSIDPLSSRMSAHPSYDEICRISLPPELEHHAISIDKLAELLNSTHGEQTAILDCRSFVAYNSSHIRGALNMTCPTLVLKRLQARIKKESIATEEDRLSWGAARANGGGKVKYGRYLYSGAGISKKVVPKSLAEKDFVMDKLLSSPEPEYVSLKERCKSGVITHMVLCGDESLSKISNGEHSCLLERLLDILNQQHTELHYLDEPYVMFARRHPDLVFRLQSASTKQGMPRSITPPPSGVPASSNMQMEPTEVLDYLYLGNKRNSADIDNLKNLGITHVLNVAKECTQPLEKSLGLQYKNVPLLDSTEEDILSILEETIRFIDDAKLSSGKVLVHCVGGISRSVSVVLAYLVRTHGMTLDTAYAFMKERKSNISPNISFMGQLLEFSKCEENKRYGSGG
eukprot:CFRG1406T1